MSEAARIKAMTADVLSARKAGYSDTEIADYLGGEYGFDVGEARGAGMGDADIISQIVTYTEPAKTKGEIAQMASDEAWQKIRARSPGEGAIPSIARGSRTGMVQVGKGASDFVTGVRQLAADVAPGMEDTERALRNEANVSAELGAPLADKEAGLVGPMAGGVAASLPVALAVRPVVAAIPAARRLAAPAATVSGRVAQGSAVGAAYGAAAPVTDENSRAGNVAMGAAAGAAGAGVGEVVGRAITPIARAANPALERAVRGAERLGVRLTAGQRTGSAGLQRMEASLESTPFTAGPMAAIREGNQQAINRSVARAFGENADNLSEGVIDRAFVRIGGVFDKLTKGRDIPLDDAFVGRLAEIERQYQGVWSSLKSDKLGAVLDDALNAAAKGRLTGAEYQAVRSRLDQVARGMSRSEGADRETMLALYAVKDAVDDAAARSLPNAQQAELNLARRQYRDLINTVRSGAVDPATGNVSGRKLANALTRRDMAGMVRGRNTSDMYEAARTSKRFAPVVGDSGTATRMSVPAAVAGQAGISGGALLAGIDPMTALIAPAAVAGGANALTRLYTSRPATNYLSNQLLNETARNALTRSGALLAAP